MERKPTTYLRLLAVVLGITLFSSLTSCDWVGQQGMIPQTSTQDSQSGNAQQRNAKEEIARILAVVEENKGHHSQADSDSNIGNIKSLITSNKDAANVPGPNAFSHSAEENLNVSSSQQRKKKEGWEKPVVELTSAGRIRKFVEKLNKIVKNPDLNNAEKLQQMKQKDKLPQVLLQKNEHKRSVLDALVKLALARKENYKEDVHVIVQAMDQIIADAPAGSKRKDKQSLFFLLQGILNDSKLPVNSSYDPLWSHKLINDIKSLPEEGEGQGSEVKNNKFAQTKKNLRLQIPKPKHFAVPAKSPSRKNRGNINKLKSQKARAHDSSPENTYDFND